MSTSPWINFNLLTNKESSDNTWEEYLHLSQKKSYTKSTNLTEVGDKLNTLFYIQKGIVQYIQIGKDGSQKCVVVVGPGCILGEEALFHNQPILYYAKALTRLEVYVFPKEVIKELIKTDYQISYFIINSLALKSRVLAAQLDDFTSRNTLEKLCRILYCFTSYDKQDDTNFEYKLSHQELALLVGAHRVSITNTLKKLRKDNIINYYNNNLIVKDRSKLREIGFGY
ncbi:MAG: Crp/Fnr family transcriptional regulator [Clostridiales bacterium]|nr:Crp/Fnr family transcriptional regulator [Clostridiales bacterium]